MEKEERENYIEAGEVVQEARKLAREKTEAGVELRRVAEEIESLIQDRGLEPAFPVNMSVNEEAAHFTPGPGSEKKLGADDVLKVDIGAHKDGYIADTALTVNPSGKHQEEIEAAEEVLEKALKFLEPGITIEEFGSYVNNQVPEGLNVVRNLTGHYLGRYTQHAGVSIPNVPNGSQHVIEKGDAVAVEPFLTTGSGKVKEGKRGNIYKLESDQNVRGRTERKLLGEIKNFNGLPFTSRWLKDFSGRKKMALKRLVDQGRVHSYPVLKELNDGMVVQAEHTVLVGVDDGENVVTTRR